MVLSTNKSIDWNALIEDPLVQRPPDMMILEITDVFKPDAFVCDISNCQYKNRTRFECHTNNCAFCSKGDKSVTERKYMDHELLGLHCGGPLQNVSTYKASLLAISAAIQGLKYYERTGKYEERSHPVIYFLDTVPPTIEQQEQLNITDEYRKLIKQDLSIEYMICDTSANTATKKISLNGFKLSNNAQISVKFEFTSTSANPLLDVNNGKEYLGGKEMWFRGKKVGTGNQILEKGSIVTFLYNPSDDVFYVSDITTDITVVGWIHPKMITSILRGYKLVSDGITSWYEKPYGQFVYEIVTEEGVEE